MGRTRCCPGSRSTPWGNPRDRVASAASLLQLHKTSSSLYWVVGLFVGRDADALRARVSDMLQINPFTVHELLGTVVAVFLAVLFYVLYAFVKPRRTLDLLLANWLACLALGCLTYYLVDNIVPAGVLVPQQRPDAAARTLLLIRLTYVIGVVALVTQLHFVLCYCQSPYAQIVRIGYAYAACVLAVPLIWSPWFLSERTVPLGETSSWTCSLPWIPEITPLVMGYVLLWNAGWIASIVLLHRHRRTHGASAGQASASSIVWVQAAFAVLGIFGTADIVMCMVNYQGPEPIPAGVLIMSLMITIALIRERQQAARREKDREAELNRLGEARSTAAGQVTRLYYGQAGRLQVRPTTLRRPAGQPDPGLLQR